MKFPSRQQVEIVRKQYPAGTRVELVQMDDAQAPPVGTAGTVTGVDDTGSILVDWDNGSGLNVVYGEDIVRKICPVCGGPLTAHPALSRRDNKTEVCPDQQKSIEIKISNMCRNDLLLCAFRVIYTLPKEKHRARRKEKC